MKKILVLGGGGFIGGHLAKALKAEGNWVRVVDIKKHEYFPEKEICDEFIKGDLRDPLFVGRIMFAPHQSIEHDTINSFDEVYQLAADMGGAGYVFTGEHDADIMHNSALINLNVADQCVRKCVKKVFYSSSACFVKGTMVFTNEGYIPIENITVNHSVVAEDGKFHKVENVTSRPHIGQLCRLHVMSTESIVCTPDHRFLTSDGEWVQAKDMAEKRMFQVRPDLDFDTQQEIFFEYDKYVEMYKELTNFNEPLYLLAQKYGTSQNVPYGWKKRAGYPLKVDPVTVDSVKKDYKLGKLLGLVLSEGWYETHAKYNTHRITCAFGKHETEVIKEYKSLLMDVFGIASDRIVQYETRTATKIHVSSKRLVDAIFLLANIKDGSHLKKITKFGMSGREDYIRGIVDGNILGDGCRAKTAHGSYIRASYSTTSRELALQHSILLNSIGEHNSIHVINEKEWSIEGRSGMSKKAYNIYTKQEDTKVQSVEIFDTDMVMVYNLEVEDVHSYIVEGAVVHNCMYPAHNQADPDNPNCKEDSAYPANPDSEYGWEKLFSERLYLAYHRNHGLNVRIARFHNIYGPYGSWNNGKEKAPAAMCRKVAEAQDRSGGIEVWGDGKQTRSFLYIDDCVSAVIKFMRNKNAFIGPVNIGSEEMVTINELAEIAIDVSGKLLGIKNIPSDALGVRGRNSDNELYLSRVGHMEYSALEVGMRKTYEWIKEQADKQKLAL